MIEELTKDKIEGTVDLHMECFRDSFLSSLDRDVLTRMYENYVSAKLGRAYVYVENGEVIGIIAGAINPSVYYNQMIRKRWAQLLWLTVKRVIKQPGVLLSIFQRDFSGFFRPDESDKAYRRASLNVIGVREGYRGTGIAQQLAQVFLGELRGAGILEVDAGVSSANTPAKRFYEKIGMRYLRTDRRSDGEDVDIYGMRFDETEGEMRDLGLPSSED